ncbi:kinase-like domain-containing protein [Hyaloraphidium curvatum]|nr:kinase-like domain-containing protein [Hyaloraphidium curvatum]
MDRTRGVHLRVHRGPDSFGFSRIVGTSRFLETVCGTPSYCAPEILAREGHGVEVDVWSAGCVIYAMLSGCMPFSAPSQPELFALIRAADFEFPEDPWAAVSSSAKDFVSSCLVLQVRRNPLLPDSRVRITAKEALKHPWLAGDAVPAAVPDLSGAIRRHSTRRGGAAFARKRTVRVDAGTEAGNRSQLSIPVPRVSADGASSRASSPSSIIMSPTTDPAEDQGESGDGRFPPP